MPAKTDTGCFERRELTGRQRRVGADMTADQGGNISGVFHATLSRPPLDRKPISRPETNRNPVNGRTSRQSPWRQTGQFRMQEHANGKQGQRRLRHLPPRCELAEQALLLERRTRCDRGKRRFRVGVVHCAPTLVAALRGHFAILPSLQKRSDTTPRRDDDEQQQREHRDGLLRLTCAAPYGYSASGSQARVTRALEGRNWPAMPSDRRDRTAC
jgi:hypothetical protein